MGDKKQGKKPGKKTKQQPEAPTAVVVVVDRSGSMEPLRGFVVEGANQLLAGLDADDRVTIVQFDSQDPYEVLVDGLPASQVAPLELEQYQPRGGTPLYDAVGEAVTRTATWADLTRATTGLAPKVLLSIITDGYENASTRWTPEAVKEMITKYQTLGWTVTYIGLGIDATIDSQRLGVPRRMARSRRRVGSETVEVLAALSMDATAVRGRAPRVARPDASDGS